MDFIFHVIILRMSAFDHFFYSVLDKYRLSGIIFRNSGKGIYKNMKKKTKRPVKTGSRRKAKKAAGESSPGKKKTRLPKQRRQKVKKTAFKRLSAKELAYYKVLLLALRDKISGGVRRMEKDYIGQNPIDPVGDIADIASDSSDAQLNMGLFSSEQNLLNEIDDALMRIKDGTYGICEKYQEPIAKSRLKAMPYVRYCLRAQEEEEKDSAF